MFHRARFSRFCFKPSTLGFLILKDLASTPVKVGLWVRKWLLVFTLFIAGGSIATDLIVLVNSFLGGTDITARFILKVLSVLVVSVGVFSYYIFDLKRKPEARSKIPSVSAIVAMIFIMVAIIYAFTVIGS